MSITWETGVEVSSLLTLTSGLDRPKQLEIRVSRALLAFASAVAALCGLSDMEFLRKSEF